MKVPWGSFWTSSSHPGSNLYHIQTVSKIIKIHSFLYYFEHRAQPESYHEGHRNGLGRRSVTQSITDGHPINLQSTLESHRGPTKDTLGPPGMPERIPRDRTGGPRRGGRRSCTIKINAFSTFSERHKIAPKELVDSPGLVGSCLESSLAGFGRSFGSF